MIVMQLPQEAAQLVELCQKAGLSVRETNILVEKNYPRNWQSFRKGTFADVGQLHHLSPQRIKQIHDVAWKKLERLTRG